MDNSDEEFIWSLKNGDMGIVKGFVEEKKKDVNAQIKGRCPLHYAADYGQTDVIDYLLKQKASINAHDKHGLTPLLSAIYEGHKECVALLLQEGAEKTGKAPDGSCYIDCAESQAIKELLMKDPKSIQQCESASK